MTRRNWIALPTIFAIWHRLPVGRIEYAGRSDSCANRVVNGVLAGASTSYRFHADRSDCAGRYILGLCRF
jgi:hypothetical protein